MSESTAVKLWNQGSTITVDNNAMRDLLRAWEEMYNLPRTFQTKAERGEAPAKQEHHNRG